MTPDARIEYLPVAQEDLEAIFDYVARDDLVAATRLVDALDEAIAKLASFPTMGVVPRDERLARLGYRMLVVDKYLVFYVVKNALVEIRRVIHGHRRYGFLL